MTDRQRAAMYRARRYESAMVAHEDLKGATTAALLAGLARQLKAIDETGDADVARDIAAQLIKEICDRHEIRLTRSRNTD